MSQSNELIVFSQEQKEIIKSQFFPPNATKNEMIYCMNIAKNMGLNPITKEIFFVPRKSLVNGEWIEKVEPMLGRDSYIKVAHSTGKFAGLETTSRIAPTPTFENGEWVEKPDLLATCKVYRSDTKKPFISEVSYREYVQYKKDGSISKFWKEKPDTMLKKVAESQALRKAFNINGAYSIEEVNNTEIEDISARSSTQKITKQEDVMDDVQEVDINEI